MPFEPVFNEIISINNYIYRFTEAEWKEATRGIYRQIFPWEENIDCSLANYGSCLIRDTTPVGSYLDGEIPFGALDMAGNVAEWVADWYKEDYYQKSPSYNLPGPPDGIYKVYRSGSKGSGRLIERTAFRGSRLYPDEKPPPSSHPGFRCALSP